MPVGPGDTGGLIEGLLAAGEQEPAPGAGSELLTFLFADIRGYTRFTQQHGDEAAAKLTAKFAAIVRDLIAGYGGVVFELRGDEAMCVFTSARQSLRFAVALQQRFVAETADDARLPMTVGIGVDAGEAVRSEDGYRGGALNLAARLCSQAQAGDVLASPEITHLARAIEGIRYVALDKVALKGISAPVRPVRVLPEGEDPAQQIAEQTSPIPGTGPYQIKELVAGKLVRLTRNQYFHEWSAAAQPAGFPDTIEYKVDPSGETKPGVDLVAAGKTDWADARGAGQLGTLESRFGNRLRVSPTETTHGVVLNTRVAPFKDIRVRRALAYAIDRDAVAADWFTPAAVTCQSDPPAFPGYRPYCPYTLRPDSTGTWHAPDLRTALNLVDASGTRGMQVTVRSMPIGSAGLQHVVAALRSLGYRATLVTNGPEDYFGFVADSRNKVQIGFYGWVSDAPDPADFFDPLFRCSGFTAGDSSHDNPAEFCDPSIDRLMDQAHKLQESTPAAASAVWAQVDRRIVDAAPWIPLVSPTWADVVATRVHNYQRSPVLGVFFDQMWVT